MITRLLQRRVFHGLGMLALAMAAQADPQWAPKGDSLLTKWGKDVTSSKIWAEYPRPLLVREKWTSLNGLWDYGVSQEGDAAPEKWDGTILVPFCLESALSGVGRVLEPSQFLWYSRKFDFKPSSGKRTLLHFDAVDQEAEVWVNDRHVGGHKGGYSRFSFDITEAIKTGANMVRVRVKDATEGFQPHGKQSLQPAGIWYTRSSGIWQTVWLEEVPSEHITSLKYTSDLENGLLQIDVGMNEGAAAAPRLRATARFGGEVKGETEGGKVLKIPLEDPKLWTPDQPNIYDIEVSLIADDGTTIEKVLSYAAFRTVGMKQDEFGIMRATLNGQPYFLFGTLDQGYWPDGLLTPPSDAAMRSDLEFLKAAGFNMVRKHLKVEPERYYMHCDRLGLAVWQDQVSSGTGIRNNERGISPPWTRFAPNPKDADWSDEAHQQWLNEYKAMVDQLRGYQSILIWSLFNEAWGQHGSMETGAFAKGYDSTRLLCAASGGNYWAVGDVASSHGYPEPSFPFKDERLQDQVKAVGEFGGHAFAVEGHVWRSKNNWGYSGVSKSVDELKLRYEASIRNLALQQNKGVSIAVYTQTSDVETELNGLLTYDRIPKIDAAWLKSANRRLSDAQQLNRRK